MNKKRPTPGKGWKHVNGAVWDHDSGLRIHTSGMCRLLDGRVVCGRSWPESQWFDFAVRASGGNRRRGTMVWALELAKFASP